MRISEKKLGGRVDTFWNFLNYVGEVSRLSLDLNLVGALEKPFRAIDVQEVLDGA